MSPALQMAWKRFYKAMIAMLIPVILAALIQFVQTDLIFTDKGAMLIQGVLVAVLLAFQKYWKERNTI